VGLLSEHCPYNKHLHNMMGLIDEPCGMEDKSAFHLLCDCPSLLSLRMCTFSKPILGVEEYERADDCNCTAAIRFGKCQIHCDSLIRSFL
jgi:hypothetical protein